MTSRKKWVPPQTQRARNYTETVARVLLCIAVLLPFSVGAQPLDPKICFAISGDRERLECYDKALGRPTPDEQPAAKRWIVERSQSQVTGRENVRAEVLAAELSLSVRSTRSLGPAKLSVNCTDGKLSFYVSFSQRLVSHTEGLPVLYRIGTAAPSEARWSSSRDGKSFGRFEGSDTHEMIRKLETDGDMYVELQTSIFGSVRVLFRLEGAKEAISQVLKSCGV